MHDSYLTRSINVFFISQLLIIIMVTAAADKVTLKSILKNWRVWNANFMFTWRRIRWLLLEGSSDRDFWSSVATLGWWMSDQYALVSCKQGTRRRMVSWSYWPVFYAFILKQTAVIPFGIITTTTVRVNSIWHHL